jgi:dipeptidyl aminopeptidase/acylaminoacyl peptidase
MTPRCLRLAGLHRSYGHPTEVPWLMSVKSLQGKEWAVSTNTDIFLYDLESGQTTNLTAFNPGYDKHPAFSPNGRYMAWESMATPGFEADKTRIMVMDLETGFYRDYSEGFDQSSSDFVWSADSRTLYFISGTYATYQLYALDMESSSIKQITSGHHNYQSVTVAAPYDGSQGESSESLIATRMSQSMPTEVFRVDPSTGAQEQISAVNRELLSNTAMGQVEERWVRTTDDKDMLVWVVYPPDFDPSKKYPASVVLWWWPPECHQPVLLLPLELPADGLAGLYRGGSQPQGGANLRTGMERPDQRGLWRTKQAGPA